MSNGPLDSSTVPSAVHAIFRTGYKCLAERNRTYYTTYNPKTNQWYAIWNVGGPAAAQVATPAAVADGRGGLLGSGTNAPLHIAHFLDHDTSDQDLTRYGDRPALALKVDPTTRILFNIRLGPPSVESELADVRSYDWRNNAWIRRDYQQRESRINSHR